MLGKWKKTILTGTIVCSLIMPMTASAESINGEAMNQNVKSAVAMNELLLETQKAIVSFGEMAKVIAKSVKTTHDNIHRISQAIRQAKPSHPE